MSANDGKVDAGNDGDGTNADPTTAASSQVAQGGAQPAANPAAPVAAAVAVNVSANAMPETVNASAAGMAIGEPTKARVRSTLSVATAAQESPSAQDTADAPSAKQTVAASAADSTASAGPASSDQATKTLTPVGKAPQQSPLPVASDANAPAPTAGPSSANANQPPGEAVRISSISSSDTAAGSSNTTGSTKADLNGLPNFGFSPSASAATPSTTAPTALAAATSDTAPAATVPIAGIAVAIAARAQAGSNQFEIRLSPPELGRIDVQLNVDASGQVTSHMTVERADTLQLLQSQQPQLQSALEQAGLTTADNGLQFTLRDQSFAGQNNNSGSQPTAQLVIPEPDLAPIAATQIYTRAGLGGGVDIRV
jgi:flagellar hook-length control protein FliK